MSSPTWTPGGLSSELRPYAAYCWRIVEAQHRYSTLKLTDSLAEQALLEELIEESKPSIPAECRHLHFLLSTPFRYGAAYPKGSRFRRAGHTPGVFYAAEQVTTAVAEMAFYRLLFFAESPETPWPSNAAEYTAFSAALDSKAGLDLTLEPLSRDAAFWLQHQDYSHCQTLADAARTAGAEVIRYQSVRDPQKGCNVAVLSCAAFARRDPVNTQTWRVHLSGNGVQALCEFPSQSVEFGRDAFAADPRLSEMTWERGTRFTRPRVPRK